MIDFSRNHFELFGQPERFAMDVEAVEQAYRALQSEVHPDRHASGGDADRRLALQASARVNEAFRTLRDPMLRAQYLLLLHGIDAADEKDTSLPLDFLESALERREAVAEATAARDEDALDAMLRELRLEMRSRERDLERLIDGEHAWEGARVKVRELRFLSKLADDIDSAISAVES